MYNNQIINSSNQIKTTWNITKAETNRLKGPANYQNSPENYNAKNNYTSLSQIICSCVVKLKYDGYSYIYRLMNLPSFFSPFFTAVTLQWSLKQQKIIT